MNGAGKIAFLEARLAQAYEEEAKKEAVSKWASDDDWPEETVILFKRKFKGNGHEYTYAALKAGDRWYVTGRSQSGYRVTLWDLAWSFLAPAMEETGEVWVASEWRPIAEWLA